MLFSSPVFLFLFLPAILGLYFATPPRWRNAVLLASSLVFYAWGEQRYVLIMLAIIVVNYRLGRRVQLLTQPRARHAVVALAVIVNLGFLVVIKYSNFLVDQLNPL